MEKIIEIKNVKIKSDKLIEITFEDGLVKNIDMKTIIRNGVSNELNNDIIFNSVKIEYGTVVWNNGFDLCPVFLRDY